LSWLGEFFSTLPDVFVALWTFGRGWTGVLVTIGSIVLTALFCLIAIRLRDEQGWLSAIFGMMAATIAAWWAFGILPSAWIYFADGQRDLMENQVIPGALVINGFTVMGNFYQVFRDIIVVIENTVAVVLFAMAALWIQKRYPRALAEGEEPRPQSGGYK
jgi:Zn-dependent protease with chaperone function